MDQGTVEGGVLQASLSYPQHRGSNPIWAQSLAHAGPLTRYRGQLGGPRQNHAKSHQYELSHITAKALAHQLGHHLGPGR